MSVRNGVKIIVNADTDIDDVTAGATYVARGGVHDLKGACIFNDENKISYLEPNQFEYADESDKPKRKQDTKPEAGCNGSNPLDKFFIE